MAPGNKGEFKASDIIKDIIQDAPNYIFATVDFNGNQRWHKMLGDERMLTYSSAGEWSIKNVSYSTTHGGITVTGRLYELDNPSNPNDNNIYTGQDWKMFPAVNSEDNYNAYTTSTGKNSLKAVTEIQAPNGYRDYPNFKYIFRFRDNNSSYIYKLFQKNYNSYNTTECNTANNRYNTNCTFICGQNNTNDCKEGRDQWCLNDMRYDYKADCRLDLLAGNLPKSKQDALAHKSFCGFDDDGNIKKTMNAPLEYYQQVCQEKHDQYCCDNKNNSENIYKSGCAYLYKPFIKKGYLKYDYFDITNNANNHILTEYKYGLQSEKNINPKGQQNYFKTVITGFMTFPEDNQYYISFKVDDTMDFTLYKANNNTSNINLIQNSYSGQWNENGPYTIKKGTYGLRIISTEGTGGQELSVLFKVKDSVDRYIQFPPSWFSTEFPVNLATTYNTAFNAFCGIGDNWKNDIGCIKSIYEDTTNTLLPNYENKIIAECEGKNATQISQSNACKDLYKDTSNSNKIQKSFCKVNNNFKDNPNCSNILTLEERLPLYNNYCVPNGIYNPQSDYNQCDTYYNSTTQNKDKYNDAIKNYCATDVNLFNTSCIDHIKNDKYKAHITNARNEFCVKNENINNTNCLPYVKANLKTFVPNIVSMCETDDGTINNTDICNYAYTNVDTLKDSVIKASKDRIDIENCKKNNNFINDQKCKKIVDDNKGDFVESYIKYCNEGTNIASDKCSDFYSNTLENIKSACKNTFTGAKENFDNNYSCGCCNQCIGSNCGCCNSCGQSTCNQSMYLLLFIFIILCICILPNLITCNKLNIINLEDNIKNNKKQTT